MNRTTLKIAGESGMGLVSVGMILAKTLKDLGFYLNMDREYPSLIKGGHSNLQIDFDDEPVHSLTTEVDFVVALDRAGLERYVESVKKGGVVIHGYERFEKIKDLSERAKKRNVTLLYLPARHIAESFGGNSLMINMVLLGLLWRALGFDLKPLEVSVSEQFASKPKLLKIDLECLRAGYAAENLDVPECNIKLPNKKPDTILVDGNLSIALGAIQAGVRAYYAYPMSPSSSILTHLADFADETGMVVKQAEDEITSVQMAIGSMHMGTRAFCGTSGGGFDLMTESISLAGMIECPLVTVIAQRPGPATGLPTWTSQGDLNLAIHSAHGEFPRMVIVASDQQSCYELIQHAFNFAEEFQVPVIFLTEKVIAETKSTVPHFKENHISIKRGLVTNKKELSSLKRSDRFAITKSGVSKRWAPGSSKTFYFANGDEHTEDGTITEEALPVKEMIDKRIRKLDSILKVLPKPQVFGVKSNADISFVGFGSSKCVMLDVIKEMKKQGTRVNYFHYEYVYPLRVKELLAFSKKNTNMHLIEGNSFGQLGELIKLTALNKGETFEFKGRLLKYDGRPFFVEEVIDYIQKHS